ncbi:hypothetical protein MSP8887_03701 [Marinomonas spartinae]|uniref:Uncharacterized protein n=1 Tax=Marinomonas spartinae TaxID=1792290 RepID=A0A1A8TIM4_9GAMM|nr:hypothetical protein [Marinomonas spartinae]SBS33540.1 hypothetical protein MSP8886_02786 [Marinomonas spartinae]SBS39195.1 hypothetical protein MSP8887_03701 [Marinomonas spartinae]
MSKINLQLDQKSAYVLLEAMTNEIARWRAMTEETVGEDALADYGNDMIHLLDTYEQLKDTAVKEFGEHILDFTRGE